MMGNTNGRRQPLYPSTLCQQHLKTQPIPRQFKRNETELERLCHERPIHIRVNAQNLQPRQ